MGVDYKSIDDRLNSLSDEAQIAVIIVRDSPGAYNKIPLLSELMSFGLSSKDALAAFNEARKSNLIRPEFIARDFHRNPVDSGAYYPIISLEELSLIESGKSP